PEAISSRVTVLLTANKNLVNMQGTNGMHPPRRSMSEIRDTCCVRGGFPVICCAVGLDSRSHWVGWSHLARCNCYWSATILLARWSCLAKALLPSTAMKNPEFCVQVQGTSRELAPLVRDDVYRIASEALRNAFRHAHAARIEVEIRY